MARKPAGAPNSDAAKPAGTQSAGTRSAKGPSAKPARARGAASRGKLTTIEAPSRPPVQDFVPLGEVLGQDRALDLLAETLASGHLPHALMFSGPAGLGKFSLAWAFAATLLDPGAKQDLAKVSAAKAGAWLRAPRDSEVQRLARVGEHPDLHVIRKELASNSRDEETRKSKQTNIPIAVVREFLIEPAARSRQVQGDSLASKVLIVDEAQLLAREGQNALLKTLEEPPEGTVIILVTASEDKLAQTIRSRCRRVPFVPLSDHDMKAILQRRGVTAAPWLLTFAEGSPGAAVWAVEANLEPWFVRFSEGIDLLARGGYRHDLSLGMLALTEACKAKIVDADDQASREVAGHHASAQVLHMVGTILRARLRADAARGAERGAFWASCIEHVARAEGYITRNVQPSFVFEDLVASMRAEAGVTM